MNSSRESHIYTQGPSSTQRSPALMVIATVAIALIAVTIWLSAAPPSMPMHFAIVPDRSGSKSNNCADVKSIANAYIATANGVKDSTISFIPTGDDNRDQEPEHLAAVVIPTADITPFPNGSEDIKDARYRVVQELVRACQTMGQTNKSPIRRAVERAVEHLKAKGCGDGRLCGMTVITDLDEESVDGLRNRKLQPIPNQGIGTKFCGYSDRVNGMSGSSKRGSIRTAADITQMKEDWIANVAEAPVFDPFCSVDATTGVGN